MPVNLLDMRITLSLLLLLLFSSVPAIAREWFYYGPNGRQVDSPEKAVMKKEVRISGSRYRVRIHVLSDDQWTRARTERIRESDDGIYTIRYRERKLLPVKYEIHFEERDGDVYYFEEKQGGRTVRTGYASSIVPLHLEGKVIDYHGNGSIKSEAVYSENMLVSNRNYNPDGTEYIHDVFYSTETPALYRNGNEYFRKFVNSRLAVHDLRLQDVSDLVIIGAVVMETGELAGVHVLEGRGKGVNEFFRRTIELLPGGWEPAKLNGEPVRSFIRFPFNINKTSSQIQYLDISKDGQLFWHY
jgi:hypothetical protein